MSATVETSTPSWRKRHREEDTSPQMDLKKPRSCYYRLASESSKASEEDTESVCSLQDRETDVVRDTSDTDSKSDQDEYEVIEYEVASLSESDNDCHLISSSGSEDMMLVAAAAAAICDSSLERWITDGEESDNSSSLDESSLPRLGFTNCLQCKSEKNNPLYTYCEKCFQSCRQCKMRKTYKGFPLCISCHKDRRKYFPPRPRGHRKARNIEKKRNHAPVKLDLLRSCLSGLSQDSGVGSSQECPVLDFDQIIVPDKHLKSGTSKVSNLSPEKTNSEEHVSENSKTTDADVLKVSTMSEKNDVEELAVKKPISGILEDTETADSESFSSNSVISRKRSFSESSLSDIEVKKPQKIAKKSISSVTQSSSVGSEISSCSSVSTERSTSENSELCIFCNNAPKDSIFLHTNIAHQCCCYKCAKRTLHTTKRCPICNRAVNKVVRIFTA